MNNSLFVNLLNLYKKNSRKTPVEDFTTEVLAGVFSSNEKILDEFVNVVLKIEGKGYSVSTQKVFQDSVIDMVFENEDRICFLENKVDALEGKGQLKKYAKLLCSEYKSKNVFLRYCTKFNDKKYEHDYSPLNRAQFLQFRWANVFEFLDNIDGNQLTQTFKIFLEEMGMSSIPDFKIDDLFAMKQFASTIQKMDECFEIIKPKFSDLFGDPYLRDYASLKQIPNHNRYAMWREGVLPDEYSEILLAFGFEKDSGPTLYSQCYCDKKHKKIESLKICLKNNISALPGIDYEDNEFGFCAWFEKKVSDFLSSDNQYQEIANWFVETMEIWRKFMDNNRILEWDLP